MESQENKKVIEIEDFELFHKQIRKLEDKIQEKNEIIKKAYKEIIELRAIISDINKITKI